MSNLCSISLVYSKNVINFCDIFINNIIEIYGIKGPIHQT